MDIILSYLHWGYSTIVPFVILLGLLIFVHELGHFAVAKWCGVRVEVFSLGFGKKILSRKRGDTTYALSLIPLGGYVKMYGDEVGAAIPEEDKRYSFLHKPVWQRIAVVLAGPMMNFFFAIFVFFCVAVIGEEARSPIVGDVPVKSPAFEAGLRSGDEILSIAGQHVQTWEDFQKEMNHRIGQAVEMRVQRYGFNEPVRLQISPQPKPNPNLLSMDSTIGEVEGLSNNSSASLLGVRSKTPADQMGLRTGDRVSKINGQEIHYYREIEPHLLPLQGQEVKIEVERWPSLEAKDPEIIPMQIKLPTFASLESLGLEKADLFLAKIMGKSPAERAGLQAGDRLLMIGSTEPHAWEDVLETVKSYKGDGDLTVKVLRQGEEKTFTLQPELTSQLDSQGAEDRRYTIGIVPWVVQGLPATKKVQAESIGEALHRGVDRTWEVTEMTVLSFIRLAQNKISPKSLGGVLSIGQAASETFKIGISAFLTMMGIISVNLFILNLLPIPVLDGGHLLFYTIEALRGAPVSMRKMEIAQQVGLVLLMSLMVFALFNDFSRLFGLH